MYKTSRKNRASRKNLAYFMKVAGRKSSSVLFISSSLSSLSTFVRLHSITESEIRAYNVTLATRKRTKKSHKIVHKMLYIIWSYLWPEQYGYLLRIDYCKIPFDIMQNVEHYFRRMQCGDDLTEAGKSISMVTVSAVAAEASRCVDAVGVRTTSTVISWTFVDFLTRTFNHH